MPPTFETKPKSKSVLAGESVLMTCQASGDPHPDIEWTKISGEEIDLKRIKVVHGKGIRIEKVEVDDSGVYLCKAKNLAGAVEAEVSLSVTQPATFSVRPKESVQIPAQTSNPLVLDCAAFGNPGPTLFWTKDWPLGPVGQGKSS